MLLDSPYSDLLIEAVIGYRPIESYLVSLNNFYNFYFQLYLKLSPLTYSNSV
jgi:hypothetical protein